LSDWLTLLYSCLFNSLAELPPGDCFQVELEAVLHRAQRADEANLRGASSFVFLPLWVCTALGGQAGRAVPAAAAWRALHLAAQLLDRVQDSHRPPDGSPLQNPAQTVNVATAFLSLAALALDNLAALADGCHTYLAVRRCLDRAVLYACAGQHADLAAVQAGCRPPTPSDCLAIMAAKSGQAFAAACQAGAIVGGASPTTLGACTEFGYNLGIVGQIANDWLAMTERSESMTSDLAGSLNLGVAYAYAVLPGASSARLSTLLARSATDRPALAEAQDLLRDAGALLFLAAQSQIFWGRAQAALASIALAPAGHQSLLDLLDRASLLPGKVEGGA
jgi:geranylgeranyl pyrophosphate synthase